MIKIRCNSNIETDDDVGTSKGDHHEDDGTKGRGIRPSKSDTSLTDSFVVVDSEYGGRKKGQGNQNILREGFRWQRQLVFRSKLTMHTAYDRKDNAEPASITALAVAKDHRTLYVGKFK